MCIYIYIYMYTHMFTYIHNMCVYVYVIVYSALYYITSSVIQVLFDFPEVRCARHKCLRPTPTFYSYYYAQSAY